MAAITHRTIKTNGVNMHIAEQGTGPLVLLLHGFPEIWYSWRFQIPVLAAAGFHVVAPDMRGCGQTEAPRSAELYTAFHLVGDLICLLDALGEKQVFVVGHDCGAITAWDLCLLRPDRVKAVIALSVPFFARSSKGSAVKTYNATLGEGFYMCRFQTPGRAERDFGRTGVLTTLAKFLVPSKTTMIAPKTKELMDVIPIPKQLPSWLTEADLKYYTQNFEKSGFTGSLNYYRAMDRTWELKAPWTNTGVETPALFVTGDKDVVLSFPGIKAHLGSTFKALVPNLKETVFLKGGHFIQQEQAAEINQLIISFFQKQSLASGSRL